MDLVSRVDDRAPGTTPRQLGESGHPWHRWDNGRQWRQIYLVRSVMLVAFSAAAWASGSVAVALTVFCLVLPFNILVALRHRQCGDAGWLLAADQYLAGWCAVIDPTVALGVIACQLVGAVTGPMGVRQRVVQPSIVAGGALLVLAGVIHHDRPLLAFCVPVTLSAMQIARFVGYLKHRNLAANRRYEELLDGINAFVFETDLHTGEVLYMNQRTRQIVGSAARSDRTLLELVHPDDRHLAVEAAQWARKTGKPATAEVRVIAQPETTYVEMRTTVSTKGSQRRVRTVLIDVSNRKRAELELAHRAAHDPLTDLPNRALFGERLAATSWTPPDFSAIATTVANRPTSASGGRDNSRTDELLGDVVTELKNLSARVASGSTLTA